MDMTSTVLSNDYLLEQIFSHLSAQQAAKAARSSKSMYIAATARIIALRFPGGVLSGLVTPYQLAKLPRVVIDAQKHAGPAPRGKLLLAVDSSGFPTTRVESSAPIPFPVVRVIEPYGRQAIAIQYTWNLVVRDQLISGSADVVLHALDQCNDSTWTASQKKIAVVALSQMGRVLISRSPAIQHIIMSGDYLARFLRGEACGHTLLDLDTGLLTESEPTFQHNEHVYPCVQRKASALAHSSPSDAPAEVAGASN